jgi:hypothetical protein
LGVDVDALRASVVEEIDAASAEALAGPMPTGKGVLEGVFCSGEAEVLGDGQAPWSGSAGGSAGGGGGSPEGDR